MSGYPELPRITPEEPSVELDSPVEETAAGGEERDGLDDVIDTSEDSSQHAAPAASEDQSVQDGHTDLIEERDLDQ